MVSPAPSDSAATKGPSKGPSKGGSPDDLGLSKVIYGVGEAGKDAFYWGTAASVAVLGLIGVAEARNWQGVIKKLEWFHGLFEKGKDAFFGSLFKSESTAEDSLSKKVAQRVFSGASIGISFSFGALVAKLASLPGYHNGVKKAKAAIAKHEDVVAERNELRKENAQLRDQLAERAAPLPDEPAASEKKFTSNLTPTTSHADTALMQVASRNEHGLQL